MRTIEVAKITGVSKRNIHFYIKEGLISPVVDVTNGYYDFLEDDVKRLLFIKNLRNANFSISIIKAIINTPASAEYYFRVRKREIEQEVEQLNLISEKLSTILKELPVNPDFTTLSTFEFGNTEEKKRVMEYDGFLVNHFLWRNFREEGEFTEYQQFLWEKINKLTDTRNKNADYAKLYDYLCSQNQKKIKTLYSKRNNRLNYVAQLSENEIYKYAEEMKVEISKFINTPSKVKKWKEQYHSFINPEIRIYTSDIGKIAEEMSPFFCVYKRNSTQACNIVYQWLQTEEGKELLNKIKTTLKGFINIDDYNHAELEAMNPEFE